MHWTISEPRDELLGARRVRRTGVEERAHASVLGDIAFESGEGDRVDVSANNRGIVDKDVRRRDDPVHHVYWAVEEGQIMAPPLGEGHHQSRRGRTSTLTARGLDV